jgi:hypothetical protein
MQRQVLVLGDKIQQFKERLNKILSESAILLLLLLIIFQTSPSP